VWEFPASRRKFQSGRGPEVLAVNFNGAKEALTIRSGGSSLGGRGGGERETLLGPPTMNERGEEKGLKLNTTNEEKRRFLHIAGVGICQRRKTTWARSGDLRRPRNICDTWRDVAFLRRRIGLCSRRAERQKKEKIRWSSSW